MAARASFDQQLDECLTQVDLAQDATRIRLLRTGRGSLNDYSITKQVPVTLKQQLIGEAVNDVLLNRVMGSCMGMAVGDSMGHMYEFLPAQDEPGEHHFDLATMTFHNESNSFDLDKGQWTDDASMGLCMADSLIINGIKRYVHGNTGVEMFNGSDMRIRFWCWWNCGYDNAFRLDERRSSSVGLGGNISESLEDAEQIGGVPPPIYGARTEDAGNGSLMRFAPIALADHRAPVSVLHDHARRSSQTTHPGIMASEACSLLAHLIQMALHRTDPEETAQAFLERATSDFWTACDLDSKSGWGYDQIKWLIQGNSPNATETCWSWRSSVPGIATTLRARGTAYNGYPVSSGYFGSYCMDGLALAMWSFYNSSSFDEAVTKSINLLGDADSHGSIAGQLAGAFYGYTGINRQFLAWVNRWDEDDFAFRALLLHRLSCLAYVDEPSNLYRGPQSEGLD